MFIPHSIASSDRLNISESSRDTAAPGTQSQHLQAQTSSDEWTINPQLTVTSGVLQRWLDDSQPEDASTPTTPWWNVAPISLPRTQLLALPQVEVFKVPSSSFDFSQPKAFPSPGSVSPSPNPTPIKGILPIRPNFTSKIPQKSDDPRENTKPMSNDGISRATSFRSIEESTDYIFHPPSLSPVYRPSDSIFASQKHMAQADPLAEPSGIIQSAGNIQHLKQALPQQWGNPWREPSMATAQENSEPDWNLDPTLFEVPVSSPGLTVTGSYSRGTAKFGDVDTTDHGGDSPHWVEKSVAPQKQITHRDSDNDDDGDGELEYEFNLKATQKTVDDALEQLRKIKMQQHVSDSRKLQKRIKIIVIKELLNWIPSIHLVALGIEHTGSLGNAHKCLMYAAKTINKLDNMGNNYDLEDLEYDISVRLRSENHKVIKDWKNVAGYQPYGILVWIWRDLCLSILLNDHLSRESGGALVARFLDDIKSSVPQETYDFREKHEILSFWDLFLTGGSLLTTRKGTLTGTKAPDPAYWSGSFIKAKRRLDHLYCVNRLNELRNHPSVDLYRTVKSIFPDRYKNEPLETVMNSRKASTVEGQIDIFIFERATGCLERLIHDNLLQRSSKRFRDILLAFSSLKKAEIRWAAKQILIGFEEEVEALSMELQRVFPSAHLAFDLLKRGENIEGSTKAWFLQRAREGYVDDSRAIDEPGANYRYIFAAYVTTVLRWNGGLPNTTSEKLLGDMKAVFLSKLGIIFELDGWVGKALKAGCKVYQAPDVGMALGYFLGSFGFEKITEFRVDVTSKARGNKRIPQSMGRKAVSKKRKVTRNFSRGVAAVKTKGMKRPSNITISEEDEED